MTEGTIDFNSKYQEDFHFIQCLGRGGFGVVFESKKKSDSCHYAVKIIPHQAKNRERVLQEVKALAKLKHPYIVHFNNEWIEQPPPDWQREFYRKWLACEDES